MNWENYLIEKGFKKRYLSDKSGHWFQLNVKNNLIKNLHVTAEPERNSLTVWCSEPIKLNYRSEADFVMIHNKLTKKNLWNVLFLVQKICELK